MGGGSKGSAPTPGQGSTTSSGTGMGSSMSNTTVTQSPSAPAMEAYNQLLDAGNYWYQNIPWNPGFNKQIAEQSVAPLSVAPQSVAPQSVAPINPSMSAALGQVVGLGLDATSAAEAVWNGGQNIYNYGQHTGEWDPAQVKAIESPYIQDVVNATQGWFNNQNAIQGSNLLGQGIKSGNAFGGDRAGVAEAQLGGQQQIAQAPVIAGLYQSGYTQALDEYNRLKAFGMQGQQLGLSGQQLSLAGKQFGLQGAQAAAQAGDVYRQQAQHELDIGSQNAQRQMDVEWQNAQRQMDVGTQNAQRQMDVGSQNKQREMDALTQNNILSQTFGPQMLNWYASLVGGVGPLMGGTTNSASSGSSTTSQSGITNPPQPNQLVQGLGLASSALGLGKSLFGKRGGPVGFKSGGDVGDIGGDNNPSQDNSGDQTILVDPSRSGGTSILSSPGILSGHLGPARITPPRVNPFPLLPNSMPQAQSRIPSMGAPAAAAQPASGGNSWMDTLGAGLGFAAKAAPLFMLKKGGRVAGLVPRMQDGGEFGDEEDPMDVGLSEDQPESHSLINMVPDAPATGSPSGMPSFSMAPEGAPATGSPAGLPEQAGVAAAGFGAPGAMSGGRGGGYGGGRGGVRQYPGLAPAAPTVAQKMATDPFLAAGIAMLRSRSPYFGAGIGEGLAGATHAMAGRAQQERLDNKPQMITHGETVQFRVGDKVIDTGIRTQNAMRSDERRLDRESREGIARQRQDAITGRKGTPSEIESGRQARARDAEIRRLQKLEMDAQITKDPAAARDAAIETWNREHPDRQLDVPARPPPVKPAKPVEEPGPFERGWNYLTKPSPATPPAPAPAPQPPATAPVTPGTKPPGVPEVRAPAAPPDLGAALKSGQTNQAEVLAQARAKIAREPGTRAAVIARLQQHGIDVSSLNETPAIPMSQ